MNKIALYYQKITFIISIATFIMFVLLYIYNIVLHKLFTYNNIIWFAGIFGLISAIYIALQTSYIDKNKNLKLNIKNNILNYYAKYVFYVLLINLTINSFISVIYRIKFEIINEFYFFNLFYSFIVFYSFIIICLCLFGGKRKKIFLLKFYLINWGTTSGNNVNNPE